jgi:hypothetical protein
MGFRSLLVTVLLAFLLPTARGLACTTLLATKDGVVLAGHNEDMPGSNHMVNFIPAASGHFGCCSISWGADWTVCGVNDQGLFLGDESLSRTGWSRDPAKADYPGNPRLEILQTCATVADVQRFFETHNISLLDELSFPIADRNGSSKIVEYANGKVQFVTEKTWYQVSTNFLRTLHPGDVVPSRRFYIAKNMLEDATELSVPLIRSVLSATHQEGINVQTIFSCICDLKKGDIYLYFMHDFGKVIMFNLDEQLKKGHQSSKLPSLFGAQQP